MKKTLFFLLAALLLTLGHAAVRAETTPEELLLEARGRGEVTVALSTSFDWPATLAFLDRTKRVFEEATGKKVRVVHLDADSMHQAFFLHRIDFFIASSGFFTYVNHTGGAQYVATMKSAHMPSARRGMGALYFTKSTNTHLTSLPDMRSQRVAAISESDFYSWSVTLNDVSNLTKYPNNWFGKTRFPGSDTGVLDLVLSGEVEVGVLPSCQLEQLINRGLVRAKDIHIINDRTPADYGCRVSSPLFTAPILGASSHVSEKLVKEAAQAVFSLRDPLEGFEWVISNDLRNERHVLSHFGGQAFHANGSNVRKTYEKAAVIGSFILLFALIYAAAVSKSVSAATSALEKTQEEKGHLERAGVVSGLSMLIAHEIRQPLTSITNYAEGLQFYLEDKEDEIVNEATAGIQREAQRVSDIVERVRQYAKNQKRPHVKTNIALLVTRARRSVANSIPRADDIRFEMPSKAEIVCEPIEIELLLANLMKNALQAVDPETGVVTVRVASFDEEWEIAVEDNGLPISDETFEHLTHPVTSQKINGLGLGLSICRAIVLKHDGLLTYERRSPRGLRAIVRLKKAPVGYATDPYHTPFDDDEEH